MVVPLWSLLVLAGSPAPEASPPPPPLPDVAQPAWVDLVTNLLEHWSFGPAVSAGMSAGPGGLAPAFSAGLVSDLFEPRPGKPLRGLESHLGLVLGARGGGGWELELRGTAAGRPVALGPLALGASVAAVGRLEGPLALSLRAGPELAGHFRLGETLHVLQPFARYEWSLLSRDRFPDVGTVGLQFLWAG